MKLLEKKAIITGGSKGIGKAIAIEFAQQGCDVLITYHQREDLANNAVKEIEKFGTKAKALHLDCSNPETIDQFVEKAICFFSKIHILVNNAGIAKRIPFLEGTDDYLQEMFAVNLFSPFILAKKVAKHMVDNQTHGSIINISSISDRIATKGLTGYQSTKAALTMFTKGVALELAEYYIRVNTISPGLIKTDINRSQWEDNTDQWEKRISEIPLGRSGYPKDIASLAVFLASEDANYITGSSIVADGGRSII